MSINLEKEVNYLLNDKDISSIEISSLTAQKNGINIFLIGGIVRDILLKNKIKDIDISVQGNAIEFAKILEKNCDCKIISVQENLRTSKVRFKNGVEIDFASTREEVYNEAGFLPAAYNFGCELEKDIKRRDFTINTLAISLCNDNKYNLLDYCNGYNDLQEKKIRILHSKSFYDDPSRIVRALKFKERLDFTYEIKTYELMQEYLNNMTKDIPLERIKNEFRQYFCIDKEDIYQQVILTNAYKLIADNPLDSFNYEILKILKDKYLINEDEISFIYICLFIINNKEINEKLNLTSTEKNILKESKELLNLFPLNINNNYEIYSALKYKNKISVFLYYLITQDESVIKFFDELKNIEVKISGKDLINLGFKPSPYFNELFESILKEKLEGKIKTKNDEIAYIKSQKKTD